MESNEPLITNFLEQEKLDVSRVSRKEQTLHHMLPEHPRHYTVLPNILHPDNTKVKIQDIR